MTTITFSSEEKAILVHKLQRYFSDELRQEIGRFDAEFLLDFFGTHVGAHYYNRGLHDAQALLAAKVEDMQDAIFQLEQITDFKR